MRKVFGPGLSLVGVAGPTYISHRLPSASGMVPSEPSAAR